MSMSDPIADMLTRIRNAGKALHPEVRIPASKEKAALAEVLIRQGFLDACERQENGPQGELVIRLKYDGKAPVIAGVRRTSKPSRRVYVGARDIPRVLGGLGIVVISTSQGVMTGEEARQRNCGGEILCEVW